MRDAEVVQAHKRHLQTHHRYGGNGTFFESDLVLGIGNRWDHRQTGVAG